MPKNDNVPLSSRKNCFFSTLTKNSNFFTHNFLSLSELLTIMVWLSRQWRDFIAVHSCIAVLIKYPALKDMVVCTYNLTLAKSIAAVLDVSSSGSDPFCKISPKERRIKDHLHPVSLDALKSPFGIQAYMEALLNFTHVKDLRPNSMHLLMSITGLQALRKRLIDLEKLIEMEKNSRTPIHNLGLLLSDRGLYALSHQLKSFEEAALMPTKELQSFLSYVKPENTAVTATLSATPT